MPPRHGVQAVYLHVVVSWVAALCGLVAVYPKNIAACWYSPTRLQGNTEYNIYRLGNLKTQNNLAQTLSIHF
jgi:hypothetical protein